MDFTFLEIFGSSFGSTITGSARESGIKCPYEMQGEA